VFEDQHGRFLVYVEHPTDDRAQLMVLRYQVLVLANGTHPSLLAFENNDLPNVFSAQAVARLVQVHGVLPGKHFAVVGQRAEADALASLLTRAGATVDAVGAEPVRAHGLTAVTALTVRREGREEKLDCDAVAVCVPGSPAFELARQAGAKVSWRDATQVFAVEAASDGRAADRLFVAGSLVGPCSGEQSARSGRVAGAAAAALLRSAP
ncbi:MAG: ferredoxin, partial [Myxococcaceae bacterium]|nr:ferredoxin [Myxococcaceae bacterium]